MCQDLQYSIMSQELYGITITKNDGTTFPLEQLHNKVVLIVNVASNCGYTPQYKELEFLYEKYKDRGLMVLGFPCNQFGHQEPGTNEEITLYCKRNYGVSFPVFPKIYVNGHKQHPIYKFLQSQLTDDLGVSGIRWNFEKFLVDGNGKVIKRYNALTKPMHMEPYIIKALKDTVTK